MSLNRLAAACSLSLVIVAVVPGPASAQAADARHVSVGAAAGIATPLNADFDFTATSWQFDVRFNIARHLASTVFFEQWQHTDEDVRLDQPISGPAALGHIDRIELRTVNRTRTVGWSLLATGSTARLTFNGGGGVSYLLYSRDFSQTLRLHAGRPMWRLHQQLRQQRIRGTGAGRCGRRAGTACGLDGTVPAGRAGGRPGQRSSHGVGRCATALLRKPADPCAYQ